MDWNRILTIFSEVGTMALPFFVFFTMFNVGLTQKVKDITDNLKKWKFHLRLLLVNFIAGPIIAYLLTQLIGLSAPMTVALLIFSVCAGAPFMIKLVDFSGNDVALGSSLMIILVLTSVIYAPIVLPFVSQGIQVSAWQLFTNLFRQLIIPIIIGLAIDYFLTNFSETIQPWVAKSGNVALWIVIIGTMVGNIPGIIDLAGNGAMTAGVLFILAVSALAYFTAGGKDQNELREIGTLATGQRNTAASMLIAANNFPDQPEIFLIITIVNMLGIIIHLILSRMMSSGKLERVF